MYVKGGRDKWIKDKCKKRMKEDGKIIQEDERETTLA